MRVLAFSCTHAPFAHENALDFLRDLKRKYKPQVTVCLGDLGDQHGWSRRHKRNANAPGQADEDAACLEWCHKLYDLFPDALACIGNHDLRLARLADDVGIPARMIPTIDQMYECPPGWRWYRWHEIDGVIYIHGHQSARCGGSIPALKFVRNLGKSCVIGHFHTEGGVHRLDTTLGDNRFGMSVGCLADSEAYAFQYAADNLTAPILGAGVVIDRKPTFIAMGD